MLELDDTRNTVIGCPRHMLVLGGPGSGKTTVALLKAEALIGEQQLKTGQRVLFLSFARATCSGLLIPDTDLGENPRRERGV
ncbi:AAA family ATPase [Pseudomonas aeruginosa]|nr:AAA family ATPase [Pseudomonas aeruginosa]MBV5546509.1 AAA family ATPase [Pseudomonas aeruginosa]